MVQAKDVIINVKERWQEEDSYKSETNVEIAIGLLIDRMANWERSFTRLNERLDKLEGTLTRLITPPDLDATSH